MTDVGPPVLIWKVGREKVLRFRDGRAHEIRGRDADARSYIGDVSLTAEDRPAKAVQPTLTRKKQNVHLKEEAEEEHEEAVDDTHVGGDTAAKFLLAGGVAGAGTERAFGRPSNLMVQQCHGRPRRRLTVSGCSL